MRSLTPATAIPTRNDIYFTVGIAVGAILLILAAFTLMAYIIRLKSQNAPDDDELAHMVYVEPQQEASPEDLKNLDKVDDWDEPA